MKKTKILAFYLLFTLLLGTTQLTAISSHVVYAENYQIDQNLDLNAVASLFGDSRDLDDFERRLNDPYYQMSNLDLNNDGYVDYLRVIETVDRDFHFITIQAVIGHRRYQDIATLEIYRSYEQTHIQVVGNTYIYGPNYIIEPHYSYRPQIFNLFWQPRYYQAYRSHYRWRHYPSYYRPWRPVPAPYYHRHVRKHINHAHRYPKRSYTHRKNHKKRVKRVDRQKDNIKKRRHRSVHKSNTQRTRSRTQYRPNTRPHTKERIRTRAQHKNNNIKNTRRPTDRHIKRERIQQRSISRERRAY